MATPQQKLDVAGALRIGGAPIGSGVAGAIQWNGTNFQVHDGTQWINFGAGTDNDWTISGINMYSVVAGNVGIGTMTPNAKLDVNGLANIGTLRVGGNYTLPTTDGGAGFVLTTDGSGTVTWSDPTAIGDITEVVAGLGLTGGGTSGSVQVDVNTGDGLTINSDMVDVNAAALDGNGIAVSSNNFDVNVDNVTLDINSDQVRVKPEGIGAAQIATGGVTSSEILDNTITSDDIATGGVGSDEIADGSIVPGDIATNIADQVLTTDGSGNPQWQSQNALVAGQAGDGLVNDNPNSEIDVNVDGSTIVINTDIVQVPTGGITTTQILDGTIGTDDIATGGVQTADILNGTIVAEDIATGGVTSTEILDGTVAAGDMASFLPDHVLTTDGSGDPQWQTQNSLIGGQAGDGLVLDNPNSELDVNVDGSTIVINSDVLEVPTGGITTTEILDGTIGTDDIATGGVQSVDILNETITAADIATDGVDTDEIASEAVTTDEIADATILPADVDPTAGTENQVLSIVGGTAVWSDPASLTTTLEDRDGDTYIAVDDGGTPDDDEIRFLNQNNESMRIDNNGNVGIGMDNPQKNLHVADETGGQILVSRNDLVVSQGETLGEILFDSEDDSPSSVDASAVIRGIAAEPAVYGNSDKGGDLAFLTKAISTDENAAATERMRITSQGNVGIGTATPTSQLHVAGNVRLGSLTSGVVLSDGSGNLSVSTDLSSTGWGDNLGDHTATTTINMSGNDIDFVQGNTGQIRSLGTISFDWTGGTYDNSAYHGIESVCLQTKVDWGHPKLSHSFNT